MQRARRLRHVVDIDSRAADTCLCAESWRWSVARRRRSFRAFRLSAACLFIAPSRCRLPRDLQIGALVPLVSAKNRSNRLRAGQRPVFGRGPHVGQRREVHGVGRRSPPRPWPPSMACRAARPRPPAPASASPPCRHRRCGSRPPCRPCRAQMERAERRGDVLVAPLGDLVDGELRCPWPAPARHRLDEFARLAVLLAIGDEEVLQRDRPPLLALAQRQPARRARSAAAACRRSASRWRCCRRSFPCCAPARRRCGRTAAQAPECAWPASRRLRCR